MSLMVWLPLNGDLTNQGLSNITVSASGAVVNASGKIGSCYSFDGSDDYISLIGDSINNCFKGGSQPFSIAFWVYRADATRGVVLGDYGLTNGINFNFELNTAHQFRFYWNSSPDKVFSTGITPSAWSHIALTYNGTAMKYYINGILKETYTMTLGTRSKASGAAWYLGRDNRVGTAALNGRLNDVRIYDHCLSAKEVKEISKGLVLHFPMRDEYIENTTNISSQTNKGGWDNSGASVRETNNADLIKTAPYPDNVYSIKVTTAGNCALTFGTTTTNVPSKTLTCSVYCYLSGTQENNSIYIRSTKSDSSLGAFEYNGTTNTTQWPKDRWIRLEKTITLASTETTIYFCTYANSLNNIRAFSGWQIEEKDHATPFTKNSRNDSTVYDCSGYGHNGQKGGNIICSSNTPKNEVCYYFNGTTVSSNTLTGAVYVTAGLPLPASSALTVSWWGKITKYGLGGIFETTAYTSDYVNGTDYNTTAIANWDAIFSVFNGSSRINLYSSMGIPNSSWQLNTITFDGTNVKYYKNGALVSTNALSGTLPAFNGIKIGIGKAGGVYRQIQQYVSDFRIYVTALSAEEVKELYQIPISVDKSGKAFAMEFIEDQKPEFHKNGTIENSYIHENEADDSDSLTTFHIGKTKTFANQIYEI